MATARKQTQQKTRSTAQRKSLQQNNRVSTPVILVVFCVLALIIAVFSYLLITQNDSNEDESSTQTTNTSTAPKETISPSALISRVVTKLKANYSTVETDNSSEIPRGSIRVTTEELSPAYKPEGYTFYTSAAVAKSATVTVSQDGGDANILAIKDTMQNTLVENGLTKTTGILLYDESRSDRYVGKGVLCDLISSGGIMCGQLDSYKTAAKTAKALGDKIPGLTENTYIYDVKIQNSLTDGYRRADLSRSQLGAPSSTRAYLYQTPDGTWNYLFETQDVLSCADFTSADSRKAYEGTSCYLSDGSESMIAP